MLSATVKESLRPELEKLPPRMAGLPVHRGYPVPWFVAWVDGVPEFRAMDKQKFVRAIQAKRCWVCGEPLGKFMTFVAGPMCGLNRTSAEPPCHRDCAQWSARNCPFLSRPHACRREVTSGPLAGKTLAESSAGIALARNPGVTLLWTTLSYHLFGDGLGGVLLRMGDPVDLEWWAEGKRATRAQVVASVESGLPKLLALAEIQSGATEELRIAREQFEQLYPKE